jgi:hypothetical protein
MPSVHSRSVVAVCALVVCTAGCITKSTTEPDEPDPSGRIEFSVSPSRIQWIGPGQNPFCPATNQASAYGPYTLNLRETGGGTVTINGFTAVTTATVGTVLLNNSQLIGLLSQDLTGTSSMSFTAAANQSFSGPPRYSCQPSAGPSALPLFPGGANVVFTVHGVDSNGAAVSSTATLTLDSL